MADDVKLTDKRRRTKKKKSSLSTLKKKLNIKKRFTNKLPLHRRHIRSLMSGWTSSDVKSVVTQYEITAMVKQLSLMADKATQPCPSLEQDLTDMLHQQICCDIRIRCSSHQSEAECKEFLAHSSLVSARWPYIQGLINVRVTNKKSRFKKEKQELATNELSNNEDISKYFPVIQVNCTTKKIGECLDKVYTDFEHVNSSAQKLLPLTTAKECLLKHTQAYRHTILECEAAIPRRQTGVVRRKQKQRFSMDERILCNISPGTTSKMQQSKSCKFPPADAAQGTQMQSQSFLPVAGLSSAEDQAAVRSYTFIPNNLQQDLTTMYHETDSGLGDIKLIFSAPSSFCSWLTPHLYRRAVNNHYHAWISPYESPSFLSRDWQDPVYCHGVVLAARSLYFRRLIMKQMSQPTWWKNHMVTPIVLELDSDIIPPRYIHVILQTMYTDKVDMRRVQPGMQVGVVSSIQLRDAMMLHHIGCFIEFPCLVQGCEEIIVAHLEQNNLLQILQWSSLPHGSQRVKRQVISYIRENFSELLGSGILFELDASQMVEVLESDYVNACELDILKCVLRWGEHELLRRIEEREPNLLNLADHNMSRSKNASVRRRELIAARIEELHDCTAPVLACVRTQHLLPPNHEVFLNAVKRGVISRPPAHLLEGVSDRECNDRQWIKEKAGINFVPPRLFQSYADETKNILEEKYAQETECVSLRSVHSLSKDQTWSSVKNRMVLAASPGIPDALYMVGQARSSYRYHGSRQDRETEKRQCDTPSLTQPIKYINKFHPVPGIATLKKLFVREREVRSTPAVGKVLRACIDCCHRNNEVFGGGVFFGRPEILCDGATVTDENDESENCNRCSVVRYIRLRVVREHQLADCMVHLLRRPELYYTIQELQVVMANDEGPMTSTIKPQPSSAVTATGSAVFKDNSSQRKFTINLGKTRSRAEYNLVSSEAKNRKLNFISQTSPSVAKKCEKSLPTRPERGIDNEGYILEGPYRFQNRIHSMTSSSDEEEIIAKVRRKRRNVSRKGSSSTTSYQSIPDVAASANSSLRRMKSYKDMPETSLVSQMQENRIVTSVCAQSQLKYNFEGKFSPALLSRHLTSPRNLVDSTSSCEENTSENEYSDGQGLREMKKLAECKEREFILSTHPTLMHLPAVDMCTAAPSNCILNVGKLLKSNASHESQINFPKMFSAKLSFIDNDDISTDLPNDQRDSSSVEEQEAMLEASASCSQVLDVPELVKDGTLPRGADSRDVNFRSHKPDIYPISDDLCYAEEEEECGKYFFCTLSRDRIISGSEEGQSSYSGPPRRPSFSFAINLQGKKSVPDLSDDENRGQ